MGVSNFLLPRRNSRQHWYERPAISLRRAILLGLCATGLSLLLVFPPLGGEVTNRISRPLAFHLRSLAGRDPALDERVVPFVFDDTALARFQAEDLTLSQWARLLRAIADQKPRAILIGKVFGTPLGLEKSAEALEAIKNLGVPIVVGGMVSLKPIKYRPVLSWASPTLRLADSLRGTDETDPFPRLPAPVWVPLFAYGPHPALWEAFPRVGHLMYDESRFTFALAHRQTYSQGMLVAPLLLPGEKQSGTGGLTFDGKPILADGRGAVLPNLAHPSLYRTRARKISNALDQIEQSGKIADLPPGAVVAILPANFSGNAHMLPSPFGQIPAGFLLTAVTNSLLTGRWVRTMGWPWMIVCLASLIGGYLGFAWSGRKFALSALAGTLFLTGAGIASFLWLDVEWAWFPTSVGFALTAWAVYFEKARRTEMTSVRLQQSLEGVLSPEKLSRMLKSPRGLDLTPAPCELTVVFIDMVGFSRLAEKLTAEAVFKQLQERLGALTSLVHKHGGTVDKSLGDGMLCVFGHTYFGAQEAGEHAKEAWHCSMEMQRWSLDRDLAALGSGEALLPLRLGIHTTRAFVGDLGGRERVDITVVGEGVNFAKRLEAACEPYRVLLSEATKERLAGEALVPRWIQIKHHEEWIAAYEGHPNRDREDKEEELAKALRKQEGVDRLEPRWEVPLDPPISLEGFGIKGTLVDFTPNGLGVILDRFLGPGVSFSIQLGAEGTELRSVLEHAGLSALPVEVQWARPVKKGFRTGLALRGLPIDLRSRLTRALERVTVTTKAA